MSTLEQLQQGLSRAWGSLTEGWQQLRDRAAQAVTRFTPVRRSTGLETAEDQIAINSSRWGLLAAELQETDKEIIVRLEAPGMEKDQFHIHVSEGRYLGIHGEKQVQREERYGHYHIMECAYGRFERSLLLPADVDDSRAQASYRNGILRIALPKLHNTGARRIPVES